jgi:hypothetical protein
MTRPLLCALVLLLGAVPVPHPGRSGQEPERLWILPFTPAGGDASLAYLEDALPAFLMVAITGAGPSHSIVERERMDAVLAEQSLSLAHLTSAATRQRVGRLLGATVMISGSFARVGDQLLVTMRAVDLESGVIAASAEGRGPLGQPAELVTTLYGRLAGDPGPRLPSTAPNPIDQAPLANLHFMKGLGHYFAARYTHALGEFLLASEDDRLRDLGRFWQANAYLAQRQYSHACLELVRLRLSSPPGIPAGEIAARIRTCERYLSAEDLKMIRDLAARRDSIR